MMDKLNTYSHHLLVAKVNHGTTAASSPTTSADHAKIVSIGTQRSFRYCVRAYLSWRAHHALRIDGLHSSAVLEEYLADQAEVLGQKALDQHRQALQVVFGVRLKKFQSALWSTIQGKDLTKAELSSLLAVQSERLAFSTLLCLDSGLRASELFTIRRIDEQQPSQGRSWRSDLFIHRAPYRTYSVWGKGGLRRAIAVSIPIADRLDELRLEQPLQVFDREVKRLQHYNLVAGQSFSQLFSRSAKSSLGYAIGAHSMRHAWAKNRYAQLLQAGVRNQDALALVSQESGHFRPSITMAYLHSA
jgi:integrase